MIDLWQPHLTESFEMHGYMVYVSLRAHRNSAGFSHRFTVEWGAKPERLHLLNHTEFDRKVRAAKAKLQERLAKLWKDNPL